MKKIIVTLIILFVSIGAWSQEISKELIPGRIFIIDNEGNIYTDIDDHSIGKYAPNGKFILKIGQQGEGPSDIKRLGWFTINPKDNLLYVTEFAGGNRWVSKFSLDGKYIGEYRIDHDWLKWEGLSFIEFDCYGNAYIDAFKNTFKRYKTFVLGTVKRNIFKFSPKGEKLTCIYEFESIFNAERGGKGNITIPFSNYLYWKVYQDNVFVRENWEPVIKVFGLDGKLQKKFTLPFKREKLKKTDLQRWETWMRSQPWVKEGISQGWFDLDFWMDRLPFPKYKPVSGKKMFIDPEGFLLSGKFFGFTSDESIWARINPVSGECTVKKLPQNQEVIYIDKNYYYFLKEDKNGNDEYLHKVHKNDLGNL